MKQKIVLKHECVEFIPEALKDGTVYISIRFATVSHFCVCGCKNKVVTPLRPTDWKLIFDGKTISLHPSIGNSSFPCRSHYWITNNRVKWVEPWSQEKIAAGRAYDRQAKERYFDAAKAATDGVPKDTPRTVETGKPELGLRQKLKEWWSMLHK